VSAERICMGNAGDVLPGTNDPGGYAEGRFRDLRDRQRRRLRPLTWPLLAVSVLLALWGFKRTDWFTGLLLIFAGAVYTMVLVLRDWMPHPIQKWGDGAEAERDTARRLAHLPQGEWHVWHDLGGKYGNVDHLVIGPAGVFALDTKAWWGQTLTFENRQPVLTARHQPERGNRWAKVPSAAGASAAAQSRALRALVGASIRVTPVVVAWADTERMATETGGVTYVRGEAVDQWLLGLPHVVSPDTVSRLAAAVGR